MRWPAITTPLPVASPDLDGAQGRTGLGRRTVTSTLTTESAGRRWGRQESTEPQEQWMGEHGATTSCGRVANSMKSIHWRGAPEEVKRRRRILSPGDPPHPTCRP